MTVSVKHGGVWKSATPYVRHNGVWKQPTVWVRSGGTWKLVHSPVSVSISPVAGWSGSDSFPVYTFPAVTITVSGGTASSYSWYFANSSGGTWAISSGQGTASAQAQVSSVVDSAYADLYCDVVVNGQTYTLSCSLSYLRTGGGGGGPPGF